VNKIAKKDIEFISKDEFIKSEKVIENIQDKIKEQFNIFSDQIDNLKKNNINLEKKIDKIQNIDNNLKEVDHKYSELGKLLEKNNHNIDMIKNEIKEQNKSFTEKITSINNKISLLENIIKTDKEQTEIKFNNQEDIILDKINVYYDEFSKNKSKCASDIDEIKSQQDVLKISYTINEKKLLEKVKDIILDEIKNLLKDKEKEVLMDLWIKELKKIINDFNKLKKLQPKEFILQIDEISSTIDIFKGKLE